MIVSIILYFHKFNLIKSFIKYLFIHINSPAFILLIYIFEFIGSIDSLFPINYDVDAVGIGAINKEFLIPYFYIFYLSVYQSNVCIGYFYHKSNYNFPLLIGEFLYV